MKIALLAVAVVCLAGCSGEPSASAIHEAAARDRPAVPGTAVVSGTAPPGAIVTLDSPAARDTAASEAAAVMDQFGQQFLPHVLAVGAGQRVEFRSSEDVLHNVRVDRADTKAPVFNVATPPFESYTHRFDEPGSYHVSCDVHPAMRANIFVSASPHVAIADASGAFNIPDVPPGSYTARVIDGGQGFDRPATVASPTTELSLRAGQ